MNKTDQKALDDFCGRLTSLPMSEYIERLEAAIEYLQDTLTAAKESNPEEP